MEDARAPRPEEAGSSAQPPEQKLQGDAGPSISGRREVGGMAVWTVTSAKPGNGVELLRDGREDTYWQSDGNQPHLINIQFQKKMTLQEVAIYLDYNMDESYTPDRISVRAGTATYDIKEITLVELNQPSGWTTIPLRCPDERMGDLKAYFVQIAILQNHQKGRDTHVRQVRIYGPRQDHLQALVEGMGFMSDEFLRYATIR